jgi:hypothetical protein
MPRHELARLKLMRQPMRSRVAQIVQPCEKSGLAIAVHAYVFSFALRQLVWTIRPVLHFEEHPGHAAEAALAFQCPGVTTIRREWASYLGSRSSVIPPDGSSSALISRKLIRVWLPGDGGSAMEWARAVTSAASICAFRFSASSIGSSTCAAGRRHL